LIKKNSQNIFTAGRNVFLTSHQTQRIMTRGSTTVILEFHTPQKINARYFCVIAKHIRSITALNHPFVRIFTAGRQIKMASSLQGQLYQVRKILNS
jgi:hypothetical protein